MLDESFPEIKIQSCRVQIPVHNLQILGVPVNGGENTAICRAGAGGRNKALLKQEDSMKIYVAGPYSAKTIFGIALNIYRAWKVSLELWRMGHTVICPHSNSAFMTGLTQAQWYERDFQLLKDCDAIVMMPNYQRSKGALGEFQYAMDNGIDIYFWGLPLSMDLLKKEVIK